MIFDVPPGATLTGRSERLAPLYRGERAEETAVCRVDVMPDMNSPISLLAIQVMADIKALHAIGLKVKNQSVILRTELKPNASLAFRALKMAPPKRILKSDSPANNSVVVHVSNKIYITPKLKGFLFTGVELATIRSSDRPKPVLRKFILPEPALKTRRARSGKCWKVDSLQDE